MQINGPFSIIKVLITVESFSLFGNLKPVPLFFVAEAMNRSTKKLNRKVNGCIIYRFVGRKLRHFYIPA